MNPVNIDNPLYKDTRLEEIDIILPSHTSITQIQTMHSLVNSPTVLPVRDKETVWKEVHMDMLNDILSSGKIQPKYRHKFPRRFWNIFSTAVCLPTCCAPCVAWDCACCCLSIACDNPCKWGCMFSAVQRVCDETYEDTRQTKIKSVVSTDISVQVLRFVCDSYIAAFETQVATRTVEGSRKANIIRAKVFDILRVYGPISCFGLKDDGNIDRLKHIVAELPNMYITRQTSIVGNMPKLG